ncbi:MAG: hypothetical protein VXU48_03855 [Verrucomicrobiota bacterium]|nr:hypothetical protein [Verrucomicrobiota bacterium]
MKKIGLTFLILCTTVQAEEYRVFKDRQGREMEALISRVSGEDVYIERKDGLSTKINRSAFSQKDQNYIAQWAKEALLESDIFKVRFSTKIESRLEDESGTLMRYEREVYQNIIVKNSAQQDIENVRLEYFILKFEDLPSAKKRSEGATIRIKGEIPLGLLRQQSEGVFRKKKFELLETKLAPGYAWEGGGKKTSKDEIRGTWVRIYVDEKLVHESSKPENMMRKEIW